MEIIIRRALETDMPRVLQLITELAAFEKEAHQVEVTTAELIEAGFGPTPKFVCFVAEVEGNVQGMALCYFRFSTWKGKTVHLEDLIVTELFRGKGLGTQLYKTVLQFAKDEGVKRVNWEVLLWNDPAIQFYENSGAQVLEDWGVVSMTQQNLEKYLTS